MLVDFWTYSCINCLRALPYVEEWAKRYGPQGLVVIGVHTPEFAFEKQQSNVERAIKTFGITYPVAMDNDYSIWQAFDNNSWPAHYFIDAKGLIRSVHLGEGDYAGSEQIIRTLLAERNGAAVTAALVGKAGTGVQAASKFDDSFSPETYVGYGRAERFASPGGEQKDQTATYSAPASLQPDGWGFAGSWKVEKEEATAMAPGAKVVFRFHARDLHMVLGPSADGKPVHFRITVDGKPPGASHGLDVDGQEQWDGDHPEALSALIYASRRATRTARSRSSSSIPGRRPSPSPSAERKAMAPLYSVKPADGGWLVYNVFTGHVLVIDGREQADLTLEQAEAVVRPLNYKAVEQLVSAANDPGRVEGEPW